MILLLMLIGAVIVGLFALMAFIVALIGLCLSFAVSLLVYWGGWAWSALRHRASPEWRFERKVWTPDIEDIQAHALVSGIFAMAGMVVGFVTYAVSGEDWGTTFEVTIAVLALAGLAMWQEMRSDREADSSSSDTSHS